MTTERFEGFGPHVYEFFEDLEEHNDREWFAANRERYLGEVKGPMEALLAELSPEMGDGKVFRINRDTRFSHDKSPYKTQQGAVIHRGAHGMRYLHVDADGLMVGVGAPHLDPEQITRWRSAVGGRPGEELESIVADLARAKIVTGTLGHDGLTDEPDLKRVPKPYDTDHPRADLLRMKKFVAARRWDRPSWLTTRKALAEVRGTWQAGEPLAAWLADNVGGGARGGT